MMMMMMKMKTKACLSFSSCLKYAYNIATLTNAFKINYYFQKILIQYKSIFLSLFHMVSFSFFKSKFLIYF
jgi:hypothetical protein